MLLNVFLEKVLTIDRLCSKSRLYVSSNFFFYWIVFLWAHPGFAIGKIIVGV